MKISRRSFLLGTGSAVLIAGTSACGSSNSASTTTTSTTGAATKLTSNRLVDRAKIGCYVNIPGTQANPVPPASLHAFESQLGKKFDVVHYFVAWGATFASSLNSNVPERDLMISWQPPGEVIPQILNASQDGYITEYAKAAKAYRHPVYIRFAAEMNGNWNSYSSAAVGGPTAHDFVLAWHRVVGIFRAVKATNVQFIWCPTEVDTPDIAGNQMEDYWPGSKYVDILAFDAYNWSVGGLVRGGGGWRTFDEMCATAYPRVAALNSALPIWICETGCTEAVDTDPPGVTKGGWFTDMFASTSYPRLTGLIYFSSDDAALDRDWSINTSNQAVQGWKSGWLS